MNNLPAYWRDQFHCNISVAIIGTCHVSIAIHETTATEFGNRRKTRLRYKGLNVFIFNNHTQQGLNVFYYNNTQGLNVFKISINIISENVSIAFEPGDISDKGKCLK